MFLLFATHVSAVEFHLPELISGDTARYQLSRNSSGSIAFDSEDVLHVTYWEGGEVTSPSSPSFVYYQTFAGVWSLPVLVDNSTQNGDRLGGRHPSLAVTPEDGIWILWHDHRHTTSGGSYNDRIEIYGDFCAKNGSFSETDFRFTTSNAGHLGDNSYTPQLAIAADGRASVAWYDFSANQSVSDVYLKSSDAAGAFDFSETMPAMQMTNFADRGSDPSFSFPDIAITPDGTRHLAWTSGFLAGGNLYYAEAANGASSLTPQLLSTGTGDSYDPPRIIASANGDVWILYGDQSAAVGEKITLLRRQSGKATFDAPFVIASQPTRQHMPNMRIGSDGKLHLVWFDERAGGQIYYGLYNPATTTLEEEVAITVDAETYRRPAIALDSQDRPHILFEKQIGFSAGEIYFVQPQVTSSAGAQWMQYD